MHTQNLHELIARYEEAMEWIYSPAHDELFKWRAVATWRREWMKPREAFASFAERFSAAKKDFLLFTDNSRMHPSSGVIKLWEKEPQEVEHLFSDVLFADAHGNPDTAQEHMDAFLQAYEVLRQKHFPGNWSYKQDRHSASVFLAMHDPAFHFVYKSSEAGMMAHAIGFEPAPGNGASFRLSDYYRLCEVLVGALKEHDTLLEKHFGYLDERCFRDESLHLLAFDLMYCSRTYSFYRGLAETGRGREGKKAGTSEESARREEARRARIMEIEDELAGLEGVQGDGEDISLLGVRVTSETYGVGMVVSQDVNRIGVQFPGVKKDFILSSKYPQRPRFEDDEDVIEAFTAYGERMERIGQLKRQLDALRG